MKQNEAPTRPDPTYSHVASLGSSVNPGWSSDLEEVDPYQAATTDPTPSKAAR